jgi:hypothetical protein
LQSYIDQFVGQQFAPPSDVPVSAPASNGGQGGKSQLQRPVLCCVHTLAVTVDPSGHILAIWGMGRFEQSQAPESDPVEPAFPPLPPRPPVPPPPSSPLSPFICPAGMLDELQSESTRAPPKTAAAQKIRFMIPLLSRSS